jgi:hypothetical protein
MRPKGALWLPYQALRNRYERVTDALSAAATIDRVNAKEFP